MFCADGRLRLFVTAYSCNTANISLNIKERYSNEKKKKSLDLNLKSGKIHNRVLEGDCTAFLNERLPLTACD